MGVKAEDELRKLTLTIVEPIDGQQAILLETSRDGIRHTIYTLVWKVGEPMYPQTLVLITPVSLEED